MEHVVIIGNGISGVTAARFIRKMSDKKITIISSETKYFFSRTALMYVYMGHMKFEHIQPYEDWFWDKSNIELVQDHVDSVDFSGRELGLESGNKLSYDYLIIATGSKPNKFGWPGQDLEGVQGLYSYQDLQTMEASSSGLKRAVIVGGGLIGIEMAEMFLSRKIPVTFLVREKSFWNNVLPAGESEMINQHIREHGVDLRLGQELKEILPDEKGRCKAIITKMGETIDCGFVGLTAGVSPNISFLKNSDIETDRGVLVNEFFETNIENVYAIGDCAQFRTALPGRRTIEQVWYTGRMHGEVAALNICGKPQPYRPGPWFNSAKFFDIEYQTYGQVNSTYTGRETGIFWKHQSGKKSLHIVFDKEDLHVLGINLLGIRHRHEVWDQWLREKRSIRYVLEHLQDANFDPEFFEEHEAALVEEYNRNNPHNTVKIKRKKRFLERIGLS